MQNDFIYHMLPSPRSIRLIKFQPGPRPKCTLLTVEVEKAPPYVALSYTWGCTDLVRCLTVNGCEVRITASLAEAIDAMFMTVRGWRCHFWADGICIDQTNLAERSSQVRLMNTIYRSADSVAIWLGPAADDSDLTFDMMDIWTTRLNALETEHNSEDMAISSIPSTDSIFFSPEAQRTLTGLRMVVQEGTISPESRTFFFCGTRCATWAEVRTSFSIAHHVTRHHTATIEVTNHHIARTKDDFTSKMAIRLDGIRKDRSDGIYMRLLPLLLQMRGFECGDPRDKIYAALGMAMDINEKDVVPDYTKSYPAACRDVARFMISQGQDLSLHVLGAVMRPAPGTSFEHTLADDDLDHIPSWVPDWTFRVSMFPFEKFLDPFSSAGSPLAYHASGSHRSICKVESNRLYTQSSTVDQIVQTWAVCQWNLAEAGLNLETWWVPEEPDAIYHTGETVMEAFNRTIMADIGRKDVNRSGQYSRGMSLDWGFVKRTLDTLAPEERQLQSWMLIDTKAATFGRRLFRTRRGLLGLGPAAAEIGDEVCVFSGGQVLYVVRKQNSDEHEFMGECYVHGMMDGEACEEPGFDLKEMVLV
ncbi:heterokaryon incompatibility protein-domain-containing protein [Paraphoma chrysanthemicola]|nr:heterokaryon incompatibility protein-domain-containing protein [Paraphoma chrysanthemicola]